jgi:hypothetical protein
VGASLSNSKKAIALKKARLVLPPASTDRTCEQCLLYRGRETICGGSAKPPDNLDGRSKGSAAGPYCALLHYALTGEGLSGICRNGSAARHAVLVPDPPSLLSVVVMRKLRRVE